MFYPRQPQNPCPSHYSKCIYFTCKTHPSFNSWRIAEKSKLGLRDSRCTLSCEPLYKLKRKLKSFHIQCHRANILIPEGMNKKISKNQPDQKHSRECIKSYSSISSTWVGCGVMCLPNGLGSPTPMTLVAAAHMAFPLVVAHMVSSLSCLHLLPAPFLSKLSKFLSSKFWRTPTYLWLKIYSFILCFYRGYLTGFLGLHLKFEWNPPWQNNSCIMHAWKTSTKWTMPRSTASECYGQSHLDYVCSDFWGPGSLSTGKWILGNQFFRWFLPRKEPRGSLLKWEFFICIFEHAMLDDLLIPNMLSSHISHCPDAKHLASS